MTEIKIIPGPYARNFTAVKSRQVRVIVIHTMEYPFGPRGAEWCGEYFAGRKAPRASSHYGVDSDSIREYVRENNVAWAAPGANHDGLNIEMAGYAKTSRAEWLKGNAYATLLNTARLVANRAQAHGIPLVHLADSDLRNGKRGIVDHSAVSRVYRKSDHWDVGTGFPWDIFMREVMKFAGLDPEPAPDKPKPAPGRPTVRPGDKGETVREVQRRLNTGMVCDGIYERGGITHTSVRLFQKAHGLTVDGIVGPATWAKFLVPQKAVSRPKIRRNSTGATVAEWQRLLGVFTQDHVFGPDTERRTKGFQRSRGLTADGVVGSKTWAAMLYRPVNAR